MKTTNAPTTRKYNWPKRPYEPMSKGKWEGTWEMKCYIQITGPRGGFRSVPRGWGWGWGVQGGEANDVKRKQSLPFRVRHA
ncbi:hypothetical protein V6N13_058204 [Hibiscus sabdariffa]|uniref:Uncharacterized protein n=1 Tax=Hibiscus sabdariffa TaxID=183260 RepID=A0ABR2GH46_9ROSI